MLVKLAQPTFPPGTRTMSTALRLLFTVLLPLTSAATAQAGGDWTGKTIILKGNTVRIGHTDENGQQVHLAKLTGVDYRVIKEQDGWLMVNQDGVEGWFDKSDAIVLEEAINYFTGRIRANPWDAGGYARRASAWQLKREFDIAIQDHNEALRLAPNVPAWWNNRGTCWYAMKMYDRAIKDFDEALRLNPTSVKAYNNRGNAWYFKKDYDNAIRNYDVAIQLNPKFVKPFNSRGNAWYFKRDYDKAIVNYDEALRLDPKYVNAFNSRGNAWFHKKDFDKAIKDYDEAIRLNPKYARAYANRGNAWYAKKDYVNAVLNFEEALRVQAMDSIYADFAFFRATCPDAKFRDGQKGWKPRNGPTKAWEVHRIGSQDGRYLSALAAAFAETGNFDEAVGHQQKALADTSLQSSA